MLFNKNDERTVDRVLYKTKPNMVLGCKKAIYGVVLLAIVFCISSTVIKFIGKMQVYMISQIQLPLTKYTAIAFFVVILIIVLYIIWQILRWYSLEYSLTETRIIIKSGLLSTKKSYMPYTKIQDINTSQSILARLFNVGTVSVFSAYDNNLIRLENISNPSKVEEIIFSNMMNYRNFHEPQRHYVDQARSYPENDYEEEYYDEFEPITPIGHERPSYPRREYEYYPEDYTYQSNSPNQYEYEPYDDEFESQINRAVNNSNGNIRYEGGPNAFSNDVHYNDSRDDYSMGRDDYYYDNEPRVHYSESHENIHQNESHQVDETDESSESVIRRHFDKFKK